MGVLDDKVQQRGVPMNLANDRQHFVPSECMFGRKQWAHPYDDIEVEENQNKPQFLQESEIAL